jgi:SagB-type dehydrogenase family enzyme
MRVRRAQALVVTFEGTSAVAYNYLTRRSLKAAPAVTTILRAAEAWQEPEALAAAALPEFEAESVVKQIERLVELSALVEEGSEVAARDEALATSWRWGLGARLFHFGIKDMPHMPSNPTKRERGRERTLERVEAMRAKAGASGSTGELLYTTNEGREHLVDLPEPPTDGLFETILARRSRRGYEARPIPLGPLAEALYAGLGITGFYANEIFGRVPLKTTPSAGAANPYEALVYVRAVEGLEPGIYHYSALEHNLARVIDGPLPPASTFLAEQVWVDGSAAIIILVAHLERTMQAYGHPGNYRAVLVEAGHVAQNMTLAATAHGISATPTGCVTSTTLDPFLGLDPITHGAAIAVALGYPDAGAENQYFPHTRGAAPSEG